MRFLYRAHIPESAVSNAGATASAQLAKLGLIGGGSAVNPVAGNPGEVSLTARYWGQYAERDGLGLAELLDSDSLQALPFSSTTGQTELDGYYAIQSSTSGRVQPQDDRAFEASGSLVLEGTRASHRKGVSTRVSQPNPGNTFGNETTALVGVPAAATRVQWIDAVPASQTAPPTVQSTVSAQHGDVDLIDARAPSFDDPILVYDLDYDAQGDVDPGVWDTYGTDTITDSDSVVQWGRVFDPAHDPRSNHELVVENGVIRLTFDDDTNTLTVESWDDASSSWTSTSLGTSDWQLLETDVRVINGMRVEALVTFNDSTSPSTEYDLRMVLPRGYDFPQWLVPEGVTASVPSGLTTLLDPIADEQAYDAGPEFQLVSKEDL